VFEKELNTNDFKVIYTGSIREANNVEKILITAKEIQQLNEDIKFYIFGSGYQLESLKNYAHQNKLDNVIFFGHVEKKYIPYILSKSDLNILTFRQSTLKEFGASLNKLFGYFASGKPIITDCEFGYDLVKRYSAGIVCDNATPKDMANSIIYFKNVDKNQYNIYCENARKAAIDFDFSKLTIKLIKIIEE
jgi:glycosyltransferase involved in cell wall biosynthesis